MFQMISFLPRASAMASASMVLPVPGSPLISRGFWRAMEMFTMRSRSSETTYWLLPLNSVMAVCFLSQIMDMIYGAKPWI